MSNMHRTGCDADTILSGTRIAAAEQPLSCGASDRLWGLEIGGGRRTIVALIGALGLGGAAAGGAAAVAVLAVAGHLQSCGGGPGVECCILGQITFIRGWGVWQR